MNKPSLSKKVGSAAGKLSYRQGLILAIVAAIFVGGAIIYTEGDDKPKADQMAKKNAVAVVVAKQDIPAHTLIRESMLKTVDVDASMEPAGAVKNAKDVVGKPSNVTIMAGDVVTKGKVLTDPKMAGFVGLIPEDCRAISVPISDTSGVGGFAKPGDRVDVMIIDGKGDSNITGEILFQDVLLLAVNKNGTQVNEAANAANEGQEGDKKEGQDGEKKEGDEKNKPKNQSGANAPKESMTIATLALTPEEALKLAVQSTSGKVYLSLRPVRPVETFTLETEYFKAGKNAHAAQAAANAPAQSAAPAASPAPYYAPPTRSAGGGTAVAAAPAGPTVEVIRGVKATTEGAN